MCVVTLKKEENFKKICCPVCDRRREFTIFVCIEEIDRMTYEITYYINCLHCKYCFAYSRFNFYAENEVYNEVEITPTIPRTGFSIFIFPDAFNNSYIQ